MSKRATEPWSPASWQGLPAHHQPVYADTEAYGDALELAEGDLETRYESYCDPRLNYAQGMEMA